jgi:hypothetical protein
VVTRDQKITLGEMRQMAVRGLLIYCSDYKCAHSVEISGDRWPDHVRLSAIWNRYLFVRHAAALRAAATGCTSA